MDNNKGIPKHGRVAGPGRDMYFPVAMACRYSFERRVLTVSDLMIKH